MTGNDQIKGIAETLENIVVGNYYYCNHCGTFGDWDHVNHNEIDIETCPECGSDDLHEMDMYDYFDDDGIYDIEYRVDSKYAETIRSVKVCVAYGGPNIYIDTMDHKVKCAWWFDYSEVEISECVCNAVNTYFEELWNA